MATVRVPDDLNEMLKARAAECGQSVTAFVHDAIRAALDPAPEPAPAPPPPARTPPRSSLSRPKRVRSIVSGCPHPVNRRIGGVCAVCGTKV